MTGTCGVIMYFSCVEVMVQVSGVSDHKLDGWKTSALGTSYMALTPPPPPPPAYRNIRP